MTAAPEIPHLLTVPDVALTLKISARTVRRLIEDSRLPVVRIGRLVRIRPADLEAMTGSDSTRQDPRKPWDRE